MNYRTGGLLTVFCILCLCSGCHAVGEKTAGLTIIYGVTAILSLLIACCYACLEKAKNKRFLFLFSSVAIVDIGYLLLSMAKTLDAALWANRLAYLGSVFLPLFMLLIVLQILSIRCKPWVVGALTALAIVIFLIAATPGYLPIYYREVTLEIVNGAASLEKEYGPLHVLYLFYLLGYFIAMVTISVRAVIKKKLDCVSHVVVLLVAVFVNIGVWLLEQFVKTEFELLAISYIISVLFLWGLDRVLRENRRLKQLVAEQQKQAEQQASATLDTDTRALFEQGLPTLTVTERRVYDLYVRGATTKEVMAALDITENTVKYHNKNIYSKLGVTSRKQMLAIAATLSKE